MSIIKGAKAVSADTEKRKTRRRPVLDSFSLSVVIPKKGPHRLVVSDVSEGGIGFTADTEGENLTDFLMKKGDVIEAHFYLNQSLFIPLALQIIRIEEKDGVRQVGAEFKSGNPQGLKGLHSFLQTLDQLADVAQIAAI